jgi:UDP-N-acetyl-D-mannosaminuronic acid dehydrogenase
MLNRQDIYMTLLELREKIDLKEAQLAVIGLGYVGLPLAVLFAECGFDVLGIEIRQDRVNKINAGVSPIEGEEPGLSELLAQVVNSGRFRASTDYKGLQDRDIVLIDVETPVDENNVPRYEALRASLLNLAPVLKKGSLVVVESTISPGTMEAVVLPLLENSGKKLNQDFYLGNCPERVMPGKLLKNLHSLSRVVGGSSPATAETMIVLYRNIVQADLDPTDWISAELVKTVENAYRDVQIAFANEVALICEALGGDVWKVRELVNKSPYRQMHLPGAGVGGHCITKDPWLLAYGVAEHELPLKIIPSARSVNDSMPFHMAELVKSALSEAGCQMDGARILVMGYAYLENSDDDRNSPSTALVKTLKQCGAEVIVHDPYIQTYQGDILELAKDCDAAVVMVAHNQYKSLDLAELKSILRLPVIVDGRNVFPELRKSAEGWVYRGIGFRAK